MPKNNAQKVQLPLPPIPPMPIYLQMAALKGEPILITDDKILIQRKEFGGDVDVVLALAKILGVEISIRK